jgi:Zn-dependent protease
MSVEVLKIIFSIASLMIAVIGHEIMHGLIAYKYGDTTAKEAGRLSINPIKHIDLVGTIIIPAILFITHAPFLIGWAKPVPVDSYEVVSKGGYFGMVNVSLAGVAYNFALAIVASFLFTLTSNPIFALFLFYLTLYNVILGMFNLLPIPPLDGSNALIYLGLWLGNKTIYNFFYKIQRYSMVILVLFLISPLSSAYFSLANSLIKGLLFG